MHHKKQIIKYHFIESTTGCSDTDCSMLVASSSFTLSAISLAYSRRLGRVCCQEVETEAGSQMRF